MEWGVHYIQGGSMEKGKSERSSMHEDHGQRNQQTIFGYQGCQDAHNKIWSVHGSEWQSPFFEFGLIFSQIEKYSAYKSRQTKFGNKQLAETIEVNIENSPNNPTTKVSLLINHVHNWEFYKYEYMEVYFMLHKYVVYRIICYLLRISFS